jgi:hypothetical protein
MIIDKNGHSRKVYVRIDRPIRQGAKMDNNDNNLVENDHEKGFPIENSKRNVSFLRGTTFKEKATKMQTPARIFLFHAMGWTNGTTRQNPETRHCLLKTWINCLKTA